MCQGDWLDLDRIVREVRFQEIKVIEERVTALTKRNLPKRLRWLIGHPALLKHFLKIFPKYGLTIIVGVDHGGDCYSSVTMATCRDGTSYVLSTTTICGLDEIHIWAPAL